MTQTPCEPSFWNFVITTELDEINLLGDLIIAANKNTRHLSQQKVDTILGIK